MGATTVKNNIVQNRLATSTGYFMDTLLLTYILDTDMGPGRSGVSSALAASKRDIFLISKIIYIFL